jgi:3-deoxy-D-manno-octulosonate 8-phosphate phosphatase KdsC-like HAD superfamily phosphatase
MIDDIFMAGADLSMSSHGGMSSFLQDFDLRDGNGDNHLMHGVSSGAFINKLDFNYRTQQMKDLGLASIGAGIEDDESHFCSETPFKQTSGSRASMQDSKRASVKNLNTGTTGSR